MGRKNKNKQKKPNPKRERYAKFHKEKSAVLDVSMPDLTSEQQAQKREDEDKYGRFLRYARNPPSKEVVERRMKSKRARIRG